ncbi:MAG: histidinol-phosphate transaminase [Corynebacterium sp.]|nr:histidinol-phosphate transaminase [Corynebacterium sp.]
MLGAHTTNPDALTLREEFAGATAYGAPQLADPIRLNTNENPYPPSEAIVSGLAARVSEAAAILNRYPDRDAVELREKLAAYIGHGATVDNVWAANGSNEILQELLQAFGGPGRTALGFTPSYSMHPLLAKGTHTQFIAVDRAADFTIDVDAACAIIDEQQPDVIFITTPNNPTGTVTPLADIERIVQHAPGIVIVDEAYAEFSDSPSAIELIEQYPTKLVVSRTMSKAFDFAGGRLGYFVAAPAFVQAVMLVRLPYHLSTLSQLAASVALDHCADTLATVRTIAAERERVAARLGELGYHVLPSEANFLFFGDFADAAAVWQQFLDAGVLIRDVGVPGYLRVTIGLDAENTAFLSVAAALRGTIAA